jgi:uncharacterized protein Usg
MNDLPAGDVEHAAEGRQRPLKEVCMSDMSKRLAGYRLTTAEIIYRLPDHQRLLQTYIWQGLDLAPEFPELRKFLDFWSRELDGPLHSVTIASTGIFSPAEVRIVSQSYAVH